MNAIESFEYELVNTDHIPDDALGNVERGLEMKAFVCQVEFETQLDIGHPINVLSDSIDCDGEAIVTKIEVEDGIAVVELDFSEITML